MKKLLTLDLYYLDENFYLLVSDHDFYLSAEVDLFIIENFIFRIET